MKIIVTGSTGMLGRTLIDYFSKNGKNEVRGIARKESDFNCDITDSNKLKEIFKKFQPNAVIHAAAMVDLKLAESDNELAWNVNVKATGEIAKLCLKNKAEMVYISSCYVFDGKKPTAYIEDDELIPTNEYAKTKIAAEKAVKEILKDYLIIRPARIYSKASYAKTGLQAKLLKLIPNGETFELSDDDMNNPVSCEKVSEAIDKLLKKKEKGVFNIGGKDVLSTYDYAIMIVKAWKLDQTKLVKKRGTVDKFGVERPSNMAMSNEKLKKTIEIEFPSLEQDLKKHAEMK